MATDQDSPMLRTSLLSLETQIQSQVSARVLFPPIQPVPDHSTCWGLVLKHPQKALVWKVWAHRGSWEWGLVSEWHCGKGWGLVGGSGPLECLTGYVCLSVLPHGPRSYGASQSGTQTSNKPEQASLWQVHFSATLSQE